MTPRSTHPTREAVWAIAAEQHDRVTDAQLIALEMTREAIRHRLRKGRLFRVARGVLAISRPRGTDDERWMTAALACGMQSAVSDSNALALFSIGRELPGDVHVSVPAPLSPNPAGVVVHRRRLVLPAERRKFRHIPVTSPGLTIIDNARRLGEEGVESMLNEACQRDLLTPDRLRAVAEHYPRIPGSNLVIAVLDRHDFEMTDSELELWFGRIVRRYGLPVPRPRRRSNGYRLDFLWPDLGLIVECDSFRYHRTPAKQTRDAERDQVNLAAGLITIRFTHWQIRYRPEVVAERLIQVIERLQNRSLSA